MKSNLAVDHNEASHSLKNQLIPNNLTATQNN